MSSTSGRRAVGLGDAYWFQEGPGVRKWQFQSEGIKLINVANIDKLGYLNLEKTDRHLSKTEVREKYSHFLMDEGDLVIASSGITVDDDGLLRTRGAFVEQQHLPLCLNTSTIRFKSIEGKSDLGYLKHWINSLEFRSQISKLVTGSAQKNFGPSHLKQLKINLPTLSEQKRIAAILDKADALRAKRREAIEKVNSLSQAIFLEMFGDPESNTKGWPVVTLSSLVEEFRYGTSNKSTSSGYPTLRIPNVLGGQIDLTDLKTVPVEKSEFDRLKLKTGDILFVRTNGNPDNVGRCAIFDDKEIGRLNVDSDNFIYASYLIRARLKQEVLPTYMRDFLLSNEGRRRLRSKSKTSAGQYNINTEGLGSINVPLPPMKLQEDYIKRVVKLNGIRNNLFISEYKQQGLFVSVQNGLFGGTNV